MSAANPFHHVYDASKFELPQFLGGDYVIPKILGFQPTKFMILQGVAFIFCLLVFKGLAKRVSTGNPVKGRWWNFWETLVLYVRDEIVRPTIGDGGHGHDDEHGDHHDGDATVTSVHPADIYLPYILSCFFYVLICNLIGAIPWMGSATGNMNVTGPLALTTFGAVILFGSRASGPVGFWMSLAPTLDIPGAMAVLKLVLVPMIWVIELVGLFIKHGVLAVRLFANIMAGHTVIAVILGFITIGANAANPNLWYIITPASIFGQVVIGLLELFVAFLQAYVFSFLATLFISAAVHPH